MEIDQPSSTLSSSHETHLVEPADNPAEPKKTRWKWLLGAALLICLVPLLTCVIFWDQIPFGVRIAISTAIARPSYHLSTEPNREIQVHNWTSFEKWIRANVGCETDFALQVQSRQFLKKVRSLGVELNLLTEPGPQDETWVLPKPVKVFGFSGELIHYQFDSGSEFEIYVNAPIHEVAEKIHAGTIPFHYGDNSYSKALLKAKPAIDNPYPPLIYLKPGGDANTTIIGCRYYDY